MNSPLTKYNSQVYNSIIRTYPFYRRLEKKEKQKLLDKINEYLFQQNSSALLEIEQMTNTATAMLIQAYHISVQQNALTSIHELDDHLFMNKKRGFHELLMRDNLRKKSSIEKLKNDKLSKCKVMVLNGRIKGGLGAKIRYKKRS